MQKLVGYIYFEYSDKNAYGIVEGNKVIIPEN